MMIWKALIDLTASFASALFRKALIDLTPSFASAYFRKALIDLTVAALLLLTLEHQSIINHKI